MTEKKPLRVALVVSDYATQIIYQSIFSAPDLKFSLYQSINELRRAIDAREIFSGFLIDAHTAVTSSQSEKDLIRKLERGAIPLLQIVPPPEPITPEYTVGVRSTWADYLSRVRELKFTDQRRFPRKPYIHRVEVLVTSASQGPIRAVTADFSQGGCQVVSLEDWSHFNEVMLLFHSADVPVTSRIAWRRDWDGANQAFPGFGAEFMPRRPQEEEEIHRLLYALERNEET